MRSGNLEGATQRVDILLVEQAVTGEQPQAGDAIVLAWDQATTTELHLLNARLGLALGNLDRAQRAVDAAANALGLTSPEEGIALPHLHLQK